ncbi:hypothetical protein ACN6AT_05675 [Streptomyces sp. JL4002]|uniref:hypothetical protein n=1 Tax=Streptomyces sp. JL4002 TaxID=3404781 RepID=UPI003B288FA9
MSGYRLHDAAALLTALVLPFLVALGLVPFRTDLSATNAALLLVVGLHGLRGCRFAYGTPMGNLPHLEHDGGLWLRRPGRITEYADRPDGGTEPRVGGGGHYYGLDPFPGPLPPEQDRLVAVAPASQAGSALDTADLSHLG